MANSTQKARARRTAARDRRRGSDAEPPEEMQGEDAVGQATTNGHVASGAAKVVGTVLAAAALGALGGATKALLERRTGDAEAEPEAEADPAESTATDQTEKPEPRLQDVDDEGSSEEDREQMQPQAQGDDDEQPEPQVDEDEAEKPRSLDGGVSGDAAAEIATQARSQLETLLGTAVERVSGLERVDGGWSVTLEVVELARIPESTDVLATYELVLDGDRNLESVNRGHRYRRSQVDEAV